MNLVARTKSCLLILLVKHLILSLIYACTGLCIPTWLPITFEQHVFMFEQSNLSFSVFKVLGLLHSLLTIIYVLLKLLLKLFMVIVFVRILSLNLIITLILIILTIKTCTFSSTASVLRHIALALRALHLFASPFFAQMTVTESLQISILSCLLIISSDVA